jgi:hypothetical protein
LWLSGDRTFSIHKPGLLEIPANAPDLMHRKKKKAFVSRILLEPFQELVIK